MEIMRFLFIASTLVLGLLFNPGPLAEEVEIRTTDGIIVYGDVYKTEGWQTDPVILLFHQGGGNARAEYTGIIERLATEGYSIIAIDQRRGGDRLGGTNRTVAALPADTEYSYCAVYPDLEATLGYAIEAGFSGPRIVWGSSYSATLAIQLAFRNHSNVDAVLAFSPASGGPLQDCRPEPYAEGLNLPLLVLRPSSETEIESVQAQLAFMQSVGHKTFVAENGVHGSSMLNPDRTESDTETTWQAVLFFIASSIPGE